MKFNWFKKVFRSSLENPAVPLNSPWYGPPTLAGVQVDEFSAYHISAFWCGVRRISADVASLRIKPYQRDANGGKQPAKAHWSYDLVYSTPDGTRPAIRFWATIIQHAITWGNGFAEIEFTKGGRGIALHLLDPSRMTVRLERDQIIYDWQGENPKRLQPWQVLHIANPMSHDGIVGMGVVSAARQSLGLAMAGELSMAAFYGNSAKPGGSVTYPQDMKEQAIKNAREYFDSVHAGPMNNGRVAHLIGGLTWSPATLPPPDEAYLKSREFQLQEVARWLNTPPTTVGDYSRATFSNVEQCSLDYSNTTIRPWSDFIVAECELKLLDPTERQQYFFKADFHQLLKADQASRSAFYASGLQWGWLNKNECREMEDRASIGEEGDVFTAPANMITGAQIVKQQEEPAPEPTQMKPPTDTASIAIRAVVIEEVKRLLRRESATVNRAAGKPDFRGFISQFKEEFGTTIKTHLEPSLNAYRAVTGINVALDSLAAQWCEWSADQLMGVDEVCTSDQLPKAIESLTANWTERVDTILNMETT